MDQRLTDNVIKRTASRVPAIRALGGVEGIKHAAATLDEELRTEGASATARELATSVPAVAKLLWRVTRDRRVPVHIRAALPAIAVYMVTPIDLVPDFLPVVGALDDALVAILVTRWILGRVDRDILREHWSGTDAMFELLEGIIDPDGSRTTR